MIIGVAVKHKDLVICLPKPNRHHHCIAYGVTTLELDGPLGYEFDSQGFYLKDGTFLNRAEALSYARAHGQLKRATISDELFSEDLW